MTTLGREEFLSGLDRQIRNIPFRMQRNSESVYKTSGYRGHVVHLGATTNDLSDFFKSYLLLSVIIRSTEA